MSYLCLSPAQLWFKENAFEPGASWSLPLISVSQQTAFHNQDSAWYMQQTQLQDFLVLGQPKVGKSPP